jgi:hypothetical protein
VILRQKGGIGLSVEFSGGNLEQQNVLTEVFEEYSERCDVNVNVWNRHNNLDVTVYEPEEDDVLQVVFWSAPTHTREIKYPMVFGHAIASGQEDGKAPSTTVADVTNIVDDAGLIVAQVKGKTMYVLFDLPHNGTDAGPIMEAILNKYKPVLVVKSEDEKNNEVLVKFRKLMTGSQNGVINMLKSSIVTYEAQVADYSRRLNTAATQLRDSLRQLDALNTVSVDYAKIDRELEMLKRVKFVKDVKVVGSTLMVETEPINFTVGTTEYVGYPFSIKMEPATGKVLINGIGPTKYDRYYHPHVSESGVPCLGNISASVLKLVKECEFATLVQVLVQFLQTTSQGDWYIAPSNWEIAKPMPKVETPALTPDVVAAFAAAGVRVDPLTYRPLDEIVATPIPTIATATAIEPAIESEQEHESEPSEPEEEESAPYDCGDPACRTCAIANGRQVQPSVRSEQA